MNRTAKCSCENLQIDVVGEPKLVVTCSCLKCQKRTGSVFGVSAYFDNAQVVETRGTYTVFKAISDDGRKITRSFCPDCGSTVYWEAEFMPNTVGVAVGCFGDPDFPSPIASAWNRTKHEWVKFPEQWAHSDTQDFKKNS